jgi:predicted transcriptional regulator
MNTYWKTLIDGWFQHELLPEPVPSLAHNNLAGKRRTEIKRGDCMKRSLLELYIDVLKVLAHQGPMKVTHVMYKANLNSNSLKEILKFLIKQGLVEERLVGKHVTTYEITQRGVTVLKYFRELRQVLPIVEEQRNQVQPIF